MSPRQGGPAAKTKPALRITDTTLRDGNQSLFGGALTNDELATVATLLDGLGFAALEAFGGGTYESALKRGEDPWEGLRRIHEAAPKTPLQALIRGQHLVGGRSFADDTVELWVQTASALGVEIFRVFDALNDIRNLEVPVAAAKRTGARVQGALAYTTSPVHDVPLWRELACRVRDLGVDDIVVKDTGGLLTPQAARQLVPALQEATDLPVVVHSHCSGGLAPFSYLAAIEAGAAGVDTALSTFGWGAGQPGVEALVTVLAGSPHDTGLDLGALTALRCQLEQVRNRHAGDLIPLADRADPQLLHYGLPRSLLHQVTELLDEHRAGDRFDDVFHEVTRVREDLGYPPLLAPVRQLVGAQAVYNVLGESRYETVTQELKDYLQGLYGAPPKPVDVSIRRLVLSQSDPITVRPADLVPPQVEAARQALAEEREADAEAHAPAPAPSDGDVLHSILFPDLALQLRGTQRAAAARAADSAEQEAEQLAEQEVGALAEGAAEAMDASPSSGASAPGPAQTAELQVEVEGEVFRVRVTGAGVQVAPEAAGAPADPGGGGAPATHPAAPAPSGAGSTVVAPMQGLIIKIPVEVGTEVKLGDVVAVLEAMKMQNDIVATRAGTVTEIFVNEQDVVGPDQPLVAIG